jgi:hypothetical protein
MEKERYFAEFPVEELRRMIMHIDRFDTDVIEDATVKNLSAMDQIDKMSEKIIEDNL